MDQSEVKTVEKPPIILRWLSTGRSRLIVLSVLAGIALLVGVWYWYDNRSIIDRQILSEANFAVYAPKEPPSGYQLQSEQTSLSNGVLAYGFDSQSGDERITVTVQGKPSSFDMAQLTKDGSVSSTLTANGSLYNLSAGDSTQYLLDAGDSLVYITSPDNIDVATINSIANSLNRH